MWSVTIIAHNSITSLNFKKPIPDLILFKIYTLLKLFILTLVTTFKAGMEYTLYTLLNNWHIYDKFNSFITYISLIKFESDMICHVVGWNYCVQYGMSCCRFEFIIVSDMIYKDVWWIWIKVSDMICHEVGCNNISVRYDLSSGQHEL